MNKKKKVLCIVPHCDDEVLSFGNLLLRLSKSEDYELFMVYLVCGGADVRQNYDIRYNESVEICKALNIPIDNLHFKILFNNMDAAMDTVPIREIAIKLDSCLNEIKPDILLSTLPSNHQDHIALYSALKISLRLKEGYTVPTVILGEYPFLSEEVNLPFNGKLYLSVNSEELDEKLNLFNLIKSQVKKDPSPLGLNAIKSLAKSRGVGIGCEYAERYFIVKGSLNLFL